MVKVIADDSSGTGRRIGIAVARFNEVVTERMLAGALKTLSEQGVADDDIGWRRQRERGDRQYESGDREV